jgi:hypothetical protein
VERLHNNADIIIAEVSHGLLAFNRRPFGLLPIQSDSGNLRPSYSARMVEVRAKNLHFRPVAVIRERNRYGLVSSRHPG